MMTSNEHRERLLAMRPRIYVEGERVSRDDPRPRPGANVTALAYDLVKDLELEGVSTALSHLSGEKINRFCHIRQSIGDLLNKQKITSLSCQVKRRFLFAISVIMERSKEKGDTLRILSRMERACSLVGSLISSPGLLCVTPSERFTNGSPASGVNSLNRRKSWR